MARIGERFLVKKYQNGRVIFFFNFCFARAFSILPFFAAVFENRTTPGISAGGRR